MKISCFSKSLVVLAVLGGSLSTAQANGVSPWFYDLDWYGSLSRDAWNQLSTNRVGGALTEAELVAGTTANFAGSGDGVLTRVSGDHAPSDGGLWGEGSVLTITDSTVPVGVYSLIFQGYSNYYTHYGYTYNVTLSFNGGNQNMPANMGVVNSATSDPQSYHHIYSWDVRSFGEQITSYTLTLNVGRSELMAFQVDLLAGIPEPSSYALMIGGLAMVGGLARRRQHKAAVRTV